MRVRVELWTDGSGTTKGPGGWAYVLRAIDLDTGEVVREAVESGGMEEATNNRAELTAVLMGLAALTRPTELHVFSDSAYVVNPPTKGWLRGWAANGWVKSSKPKNAPEGPLLECTTCFKLTEDIGVPVQCVFHDPPVEMIPCTSRKHVANRDLWLEMVQALAVHTVHFTHVEGHAGVELNEKCDKLAGEARRAVIESRETGHAGETSDEAGSAPRGERAHEGGAKQGA